MKDSRRTAQDSRFKIQGAWRKIQDSKRSHRSRFTVHCLLLAFVVTACASGGPIQLPSFNTPTPPGEITFTLTVDGQTQPYTVQPGLTVREVLTQLNLALGDLDRVSPPLYTVIVPDLAVRITRVTETYTLEQAVLPFASEIARSDFIAEGERRLLQAGQNGLEEITYRTVFEDGVQLSQSIVKRTVLQAPVPEKILVGTQASFTLVPLTGTLVYLNGGNVWVMRQNSGQRQYLPTANNLDGVIFDLSPDGNWLLYTRAVTNSDTVFNTLWALPLSGTLTATVPLSLPVANVRYAEWQPTTLTTPTIAYSTYLKIPRAPGWQANNDLQLLSWGPNPKTKKIQFITDTVIDVSAGGAYGWWGTGFAFSPDGSQIAYARTDSIGVVDMLTRAPLELTTFTAFNSHSDWAWYPQLTWSPDGAFIYAVTHGEPLGFEAPEDSSVFNLSVVAVGSATSSSTRFDLVPRAGMFANPAPSPIGLGQAAPPLRVAFLQALEPDNSPYSRYRLHLIDRDGSNIRAIFPPPDQPGLSASEANLAWSPEANRLVLIYNGNLWFVDPDTGITQQLTGDGQTVRVLWGK